MSLRQWSYRQAGLTRDTVVLVNRPGRKIDSHALLVMEANLAGTIGTGRRNVATAARGRRVPTMLMPAAVAAAGRSPTSIATGRVAERCGLRLCH